MNIWSQGVKPELSWIDIDTVVEIAAKRFRSSALKVAHESTALERVEPTLAIMRAGLIGSPIVETADIDTAVSLTKTLQNAVGLFHQDVLGSVEGWMSTGAAGGAMDLKGTSPLTGEHIIAEVKMRFNTIKASHEAAMWDDLKQAAAVTGSDAISYLFQIIPANTVPFDRPWKVSNRVEHPRVRHADGVTAYHLVTGEARALFQLLRAMPYVVHQVAEIHLGDGTPTSAAFFGQEQVLESMITRSLPIQSAYE